MQSALRWTVLVAVASFVIGQIAGEAVPPSVDRFIEWLTLIGLIAAVLLVVHPWPPSERGTAGEPRLRFTTIRLNVVVVISIVGFVILVGGLAGVDPELLKIFGSTSLMLLKDVVTSESA